MPGPTQEWQTRAKGILRAEIARRGISQRELIERLAGMGLKESESGLSNKLARGSFSAAYMLAILTAIGCKTIRVQEDD
jgi:uncharacterized protein DUF6471